MYQALYRKYRPKSFSEVTGQQHITQTLRGQIASGRLTHAYLFIGTRGTGKTTCARILSRAVNCQDPVNGDPCNKCPSCTGIEDGAILDVVEMDAASNNGVDDVRTLRSEAIYLPAAVRKRVYVIDEVHMLSKDAFNALLKILEEPPEHVIFILATTELHKVLPTIQSRCQKFMFRRLSVDEIVSRLLEISAGEGLRLTDEAAAKLAMLADGSMRDAISLLDQCVSDEEISPGHVQERLGLAANEEILRIIGAIADRDPVSALDILDGLYKSGKDMAALLGELTGVIRDILVAGLAPESTLLCSGIAPGKLTAISQQLSPERLYYCLEVAKNALFNISRAGMSKLAMEMCLVRMADERLSDDPAAMLSRIERLESASAAPRQETAPVITSAAQPDTRGSEPAKSEPAINKPAENKPAENDAAINKPVAGKAAASADLPEAPQFSQPQVSPQQGSVLRDILKNMDEPALRAILNDSSKAHAGYSDGVLTINIADDFNAEMVKGMFMNVLEEAARKTLGSETAVRVETGHGSSRSDKQSKLDSLMAFGDIVKVEQ